MRRVHIVGRKNSGKTTLIGELVRYFGSQGLRVGVIKHTHHSHELDVPGKDSYLHREAGAPIVGILASNMQAVFWSQQRESKVSDPYARMSALFADCDLVLVEGDVEAPMTKVEVWRANNHPYPLARERADIVAVVSDDPLPLELPRWSRSDLVSLGENLLCLLDAIYRTQ